MQPRVVLERELHGRRRAEVAARAAEPPDDVPVACEQVDRAGVPRGDEDRPSRAVGDRVHMEVVQRLLLRGIARGLAVGLGGLRERNVVDAVPLEDDTAGGDVDLLDDAVVHVAVPRPADRREIGRDLAVDGHVRGPTRSELKLVQVACEPATRANTCDRPIRVVVDHVRAPAHADLADRPDPPREHRLAAVALNAKVRGLNRRRELVEPDDAAAVVHDQRSAGLRGRLLGDEDVAGSRMTRRVRHARNRDVEPGNRVQCAGRRSRRSRVRGTRADHRRQARSCQATHHGREATCRGIAARRGSRSSARGRCAPRSPSSATRSSCPPPMYIATWPTTGCS